MNLDELKRLVRKGEGEKLEFKRKVSHPEKIARELVAFANTRGGTLLLGVDDNGRIPGSKSIDGDAPEIEAFLDRYCVPHLDYHTEKIPINSKRQVFAIHVEEGLIFLSPLMPVNPKRHSSG